MPKFMDYNVGANDIILMLNELHLRGYELLRLSASMSPSGLSYRVSLLPKAYTDFTGFYHDESRGESSIYRMTVGADCCGESPLVLADLFERENLRELSVCQGSDPEYLYWYSKVVLLVDKGQYPFAISDYSNCHYLGYIPCTGPGEQKWGLPYAPIGDQLHLEPYYRHYSGAETPYYPFQLHYSDWWIEARFEQLWYHFTEKEWEAYFSATATERQLPSFVTSDRKEEYFLRYLFS